MDNFKIYSIKFLIKTLFYLNLLYFSTYDYYTFKTVVIYPDNIKLKKLYVIVLSRVKFKFGYTITQLNLL